MCFLFNHRGKQSRLIQVSRKTGAPEVGNAVRIMQFLYLLDLVLSYSKPSCFKRILTALYGLFSRLVCVFLQKIRHYIISKPIVNAK